MESEWLPVASDHDLKQQVPPKIDNVQDAKGTEDAHALPIAGDNEDRGHIRGFSKNRLEQQLKPRSL